MCTHGRQKATIPANRASHTCQPCSKCDRGLLSPQCKPGSSVMSPGRQLCPALLPTCPEHRSNARLKLGTTQVCWKPHCAQKQEQGAGGSRASRHGTPEALLLASRRGVKTGGPGAHLEVAEEGRPGGRVLGCRDHGLLSASGLAAAVRSGLGCVHLLHVLSAPWDTLQGCPSAVQNAACLTPLPIFPPKPLAGVVFLQDN